MYSEITTLEKVAATESIRHALQQHLVEAAEEAAAAVKAME